VGRGGRHHDQPRRPGAVAPPGHRPALRLVGTFMQYYRESARWLERSYDFVPRVRLEELNALLVEDRDGIVAGLDERMQASVDA